MKNKSVLIISILVVVAIAAGVFLFWDKDDVFNSQYDSPIVSQTLDAPYIETQVSERPKELPTAYDIDIPFTSQAPNANWNLPYQEACEEAAALMAHYYFTGKTFTPEVADREILALVDFQTKQYGFYKDSTLAETKRFIEDYWDYTNLEIFVASDKAATFQKIKETLAQDIPIIVPTAGRELENPNFTPPGPVCHFLVLRGYTADGRIITNDPGTRNGEGYIYEWDVLYDAIHDWNNGQVSSGQKKILIANK